MYKRIEAQIVLIGLSKSEIAKLLGISYNTLILKLNGMSKFTLDEALLLKKILRTDMAIEILFQKELHTSKNIPAARSWRGLKGKVSILTPVSDDKEMRKNRQSTNHNSLAQKIVRTVRKGSK